MANIDAIPGWNSSTPVTEKGDLPSVVFINWQNTLLRAVQAAILTLNNQVTALTQQQAIFLAAQNASSTAQATAAAAQATADSGGSARSGNATSTINVGASWSAAATVNLLTVSVGDLTIEGSGPLQAGNSDIVPGGSSSGSWRVVEIVGMTETVVFTGTFTAVKTQLILEGSASDLIYIYNDNDTSAGVVTIPQTSTGSVSYRLDLQGSPGVVYYNVIGTLFVRRS